MFRSPNDASSSSPSPETEAEDTEEIEVERDLASAPATPSHAQASAVGAHSASLITASLLEFHYAVRAAELLSAASRGAQYDRHSPEAKALGKRMFSEGSRMLASHGLLAPGLHSDEYRDARQQYLSGVDAMGVQILRDHNSLPVVPRLEIESSTTSADQIGQLAINSAVRQSDVFLSRFNQISAPSLSPEMHLSTTGPRGFTRYSSEFDEIQVLGRGGFGTVYQVRNYVDNQHYAVKKIAIDLRRLRKNWHEDIEEEMQSILREIRTLACLEHDNIVRYFGAWIEGPSNSVTPTGLSGMVPKEPVPSQRLLQGKSAEDEAPGAASPSPDDGIVFGEDSGAPKLSKVATMEDYLTSSVVSLSNEPDIFTDGDGSDFPCSAIADLNNPNQLILHLQMSLHPLNLATYLSPPPLAASKSRSPAEHNPPKASRHCFHVIPALTLFLSILSGVEHLHSLGFTHRDIKPANIFLSESAVCRPGFADASCRQCPIGPKRYVNARIGDFGLAGKITESLTRPDLTTESRNAAGKGAWVNGVVGTELYRPPLGPCRPAFGSSMSSGVASSKAVARAKMDEKVDVFALGVLLLELLWKFDTRMERCVALGRLTRENKLPGNFERLFHEHSRGPLPQGGVGRMMADCVLGMVDLDAERRWGCRRVRERIEEVLNVCARACVGKNR